MITALILIPLVGAFSVSAAQPNYGRKIAVAFNVIAAILVFMLWQNFDSTAAGLQMVERHAWIPAIGAEYLVGIDGLSLLLVLLTSLVFPFALLAQRMGRGFCALMLIMQSALYGTFTAQNFVLWFLFYEMSLIPAFLLIKIWGGENRDRAATKFFVYTFLGSVAMLLVVPRDLFRERHVRLSPRSPISEKPDCSPATSPGSPLPESFSGSPSKCRSFRFTPGCPTPTKPRPSACRWC